MTSTIFTFLGHTLRLTSEDCALTECRWTEVTTLPSVSTDADNAEPVILRETMRQLNEYAEGKRTAFDILLQPKGTDFRMKVWEELRRIPYGETVTYGELARRIGRPSASRAVANACGANPLPVIIPCHRVVASGGRPGGYTGPRGIKKTLLDLENQTYGTDVVMSDN